MEIEAKETKCRMHRHGGLRVVAAALPLVILALAVAGCRDTPEEIDPQLAAAVRSHVEDHIRREVALTGSFSVEDSETDVTRQLQFDHVHDAVERQDDDRMVVCVDFIDTTGERLDVDVAVGGGAPEELQVTGLRIHKVNGVERQQ